MQMFTRSLVHRKHSVKASSWYGGGHGAVGDSGPTTRRACGSAPGYEGEQKHCLGLISHQVHCLEGDRHEQTNSRSKSK